MFRPFVKGLLKVENSINAYAVKIGSGMNCLELSACLFQIFILCKEEEKNQNNKIENPLLQQK